MEEFIVKINRVFLTTLLGLAFGVAVMAGVFFKAMIAFLSENEGDFLLVCVLVGIYILMAIGVFWYVSLKVTQIIYFREDGIDIQRMFKKASFSYGDVCYDIGEFRAQNGYHQGAIFIKFNNKVVSFKESEVTNFSMAAKYLRRNCKEAEIIR
ncbi:MAG: hypothetical protein J5802_04000 [Butyrivibrio sp.]|nr:hypothetical protein [Butyrivibrio sp.]